MLKYVPSGCRVFYIQLASKENVKLVDANLVCFVVALTETKSGLVKGLLHNKHFSKQHNNPLPYLVVFELDEVMISKTAGILLPLPLLPYM